VRSLCGGVIEASWLTAMALVPCLFNPYAESSFNPEKTTLLHALALLITGAWLVRRVVERRDGQSVRSWWGVLLRWPLSWFLAALILAWVVSTALSVDPAQSFEGAFQTGWGTHTFLAFVVLFAAIASHLRRPQQIERFVSAVLTGSLPVALYAIIQKFHLEPAKWQGDDITSLIGHPLYLAGYLGIVLPLCLWRILGLLQPPVPQAVSAPALTASSSKILRRRRIFALVSYCLLALVQLTTLFLTGKRGPLLAVLGALVCFFVLISVCCNLRRLLAGTMLAAGVAGGFLVLLNIPGGPLESVRSWSVLSSFSHGMFSPREGTGFFRADIWKQAPALMLSHQPVRLPDGANDPLQRLRPWFGYGPESTPGVLAQRYIEPNSGARLEDHFHNLVWEFWESLGAFGAAAFLGFFVAVFYSGLCQLGLVCSRRDSWLFWTLVAGFSLAGALILSAWQGRGFCGLGLQLGLAAACVAWPIRTLLFKTSGPDQETDSKAGTLAGVGSEPSPRAHSSSSRNLVWLRICDFSFRTSHGALLIIALLSACLMHLVETGFAFQTASTATLFWAFAGLVVALGFRDAGASQSAADHHKEQAARTSTHRSEKLNPNLQVDPSRGSALQAAVLAAAITTMIMVPLINMFLLRFTPERLSSLGFVAYALAPPAPGRTNLVAGLLLAVWCGSAFFLTTDRFVSGAGWARAFLTTLLFSGSAVLVYALWNSAQLARIGPLPVGAAGAWNLVRQAWGYEVLYWVSMLVILVLVLVCAGACSGLSPVQLRRPATIGMLAGFFALVSAGAIALDVPPVLADISGRWAGMLDTQNAWPGCQKVFERAIRLQPNQFFYRSKLSQALRDRGDAEQDSKSWNQLYQQAEQVLKQAKGLPGYNRRVWHLAQLRMDWAQRETNSVRRLELARQAKSGFEEALSWEPKNAPLWSDYAYLNLALLNTAEEGLRENQTALDIDPWSEPALARFAEFYSQKSASSTDPDAKSRYASKAVKFYRSAAGNTVTPFRYLLAGGAVSMRQHDWSAAIDQFSKACAAADTGEAVQAEEMLARAYLADGNQAAALKQVQLAIAIAGPRDKPALQQLERQIASRH
jgi:O-antigen ligase/tetratricopeptide (TPR) repeat protein